MRNMVEKGAGTGQGGGSGMPSWWRNASCRSIERAELYRERPEPPPCAGYERDRG